MLDPHCSLRFKCYRARKAEQRSDRIEEPANGGRRKSTNPAVDQSHRFDVPLRKLKRRRGEVRQVVELAQKTGRGLDRMASGRIAARKAGLTQPDRTLETFANAADEDLAAPNRSIVAITGSVERHADDSHVEGLALGKNARHVGSVMLNREMLGPERERVLG